MDGCKCAGLVSSQEAGLASATHFHACTLYIQNAQQENSVHTVIYGVWCVYMILANLE